MKRLSGSDAVLLYSETPNVHMHTLKIAIIDTANFTGDYSFELCRETLRQRMHLLEPFRYKLIDIPLKLHHPMWQENADVDLDYHLRRCRVAAPGGRRELNDLIGQLASTPLDRTRPLWEMYFVEGMADQRVALVGKVHHVLADGVASGNLMARAMDSPAPEQDEPDGFPISEPPSRAELLRSAGRDHAQQIRRLPRLVKNTAVGVSRVRRRRRESAEQNGALGLARNFHPPATFLNHIVSSERRFATATFALADIKDTKKQLGVTINDLILAIATGATRELLMRYDGRADEPIIGGVPVSMDMSPERITGNDLGFLLVSLAVQHADPLEWVRLTHLATGIAKENHELLGPELFSHWSAYVPPALGVAAFQLMSRSETQNSLFNLPVSNVPGPRERGRIAGAPVSEIYSVGPVMSGCGMNITVWSYVDQMNVSVITDDKTVSDPHEVTDAMVRAFIEIRTAVGLSAELTEVRTAMAPARPAS